jgi:hypothetical protein
MTFKKYLFHRVRTCILFVTWYYEDLIDSQPAYLINLESCFFSSENTIQDL